MGHGYEPPTRGAMAPAGLGRRVMKFKSVRRRNGGFGHCVAKYGKHPAVQHNRNLEGLRSVKAVRRIHNPSDTVHEALQKYTGG